MGVTSVQANRLWRFEAVGRTGAAHKQLLIARQRRMIFSCDEYYLGSKRTLQRVQWNLICRNRGMRCAKSAFLVRWLPGVYLQLVLRLFIFLIIRVLSEL